MIDKYNQQKEEDKLREILSSTKINAPENLEHRIMRQIEAENELVPRNGTPIKESSNLLKEMGSIFGSMYAVLAVMIAGVYFLFGKEFLLTPQFVGAVILVASIFSLLWLISRLDSHLREKKRIR
ncbi:MAG: hypothetical protein WCZ46_11750 [Proteiniphilum sp.]